jgi:ribonuclease PH
VDGRAPDELRPVSMIPDYMPYAEGSCFIEMGDTHVICTATIENSVPRWMQGKGAGWVTAEYQMLPRSSPERIRREVNKCRPSGRSQEIQRLIGRSLRAVTDMTGLGERSVTIDCDVVRADGGTRTASITGSYVALARALRVLVERDEIEQIPLVDSVAAVSMGVIEGAACLDLNYPEDSTAQVDMNVVMTGTGRLVEIQGTAEHGAFTREEMDVMLDLATKGISELTALQQKALDQPAG